MEQHFSAAVTRCRATYPPAPDTPTPCPCSTPSALRGAFSLAIEATHHGDGIDWLDDGTPYSKRFGDRYHGEQGALAQAQAVFLQGCGRPRPGLAPAGRILETGFGMGLNFLATWAAWRADRSAPGCCISCRWEGGRWRPPTCCQGAAQGNPALAPLARQLHAQYWGLPGVHRLVFEGGACC